MSRRSRDLTQGPLFKGIVLYTIPVILTGVLQLLFNAADLVVVGRFAGSNCVAAVGATTSIINLQVNFFVGLSVGVGVTVANALGAHNDDVVRRTVHTGIPTALCSGALVMVVGLTCARTFLGWMDTPADIIDLSALYMRIYFCGVIFNMLYNFGAAILRAAGDTRGPLIYLTVAGILNVCLNLIFVIVFHMDVAGVALATTASQALSAILVLRALLRRQDACRLEIRKMRFSREPLLRILRIGLPAGLQSSLFGISNVIIQSSINSFGSVVVSGNAAAANIEGFVYISMNALHQAGLNFTGQNYGARLYKRVSRIALICVVSTAVVGIVLGGVAYLFAENLLGIYIKDSVESIQYGVLRMTYICLPYFLCGVMDVMTGIIRGMGVSLAPMLITVLGVCGFRIGWIYTVFRMPAYHTLDSLYLSYPISWLLTFAVQVLVFCILFNRRKKRDAHLA